MPKHCSETLGSTQVDIIDIIHALSKRVLTIENYVHFLNTIYIYIQSV